MKIWMLITSLSLTLAGWGIAQHKSEKLQVEQHFYDLSQLSETEIQECLHNASSSILVCPEGTSLSLDFLLKGDLMELESSPAAKHVLKIKRTFYLRYWPDNPDKSNSPNSPNNQILISLDGSNWKNWQEMLTGVLSASLSIDESGPGLKFEAEMYLRLP